MTMLAALDISDATDAITAALGHGETIITAGFAIGALFLIARIIRRGMRSVG